MAGKQDRGALLLGALLLGGLAWWAFKPAGPAPRPAPAPAATPAPTAVVAALSPTPVTVAPPAGPLLAICIDDWGYLVVPVRRLDSGLKFPLTTAILPNLPYSVAAAEASYAAGHEVILHCPVQSVKSIGREKGTLLVGMSAQQAHDLVAGHWASVPHLVGMNNHEGSAGSADRALMDGAAQFLKEKGAYFLDSVTTPKSVIPQAAKAAGVPWARRRVFLDNVDSVAAVTAQFKLAVASARKNGSCIAIGHPRKATLDVLEKLAPQLEAQGVHLVKVSALVHP
jgi:hypothetical protein